MSLPNKYYADGWWPGDIEVTTAPRTKYPFSNSALPDRYARTIDRDYNVNRLAYIPKIANRTSWTNLLTYSEAFDNAAWTKNATTVTADQIANPADGLVTADLILETAATSNHNVLQASTVTATPTLWSVVAKAAGRGFILLRFQDSASGAFTAFFDISAGIFLSGAGGNSPGTVQPLGDGWYRCIMSFTPAAGAGQARIYLSPDGSTTLYAGDVTKGVYLWGAQVNAGASAGPYIPTTNATRAVSSPNVDAVDSQCGAGDPFAYLIAETDPNNVNSLVALVTRTFARIPAPQVRYSSIPITKPNASILGQVDRFLFSDSTLASNLGLTYTYLVYIWGNNQIYGPAKTSTSANSGANTRVTCTAHGYAGTETLLAYGNSGSAQISILFVAGTYTVIDANTIDLLNVNYASATIKLAAFYRNYTPGPTNVGVRITENFYLPGVTAGISTGADIAIPSPLLNDAQFLFFVVTYLSGYQTYNSSQPDQWNNTPIYMMTVTEINMANV